MHQIGINNIVSASGTALSKNQILLIKRLTKNITLLFDNDKAGISATIRSIDLCLQLENTPLTKNGSQLFERQRLQ